MINEHDDERQQLLHALTATLNAAESGFLLKLQAIESKLDDHERTHLRRELAALIGDALHAGIALLDRRT